MERVAFKCWLLFLDDDGGDDDGDDDGEDEEDEGDEYVFVLPWTFLPKKAI